MAWTAVKTNKGLALDQKLIISGGQLAMVRAGAGQGVHTTGTLAEQTALTNPAQITVGMSEIRKNSPTQFTVPVLVSNVGVETELTIYQIGIFATDPNEGQILYVILEDEDGVVIPSEDEAVGFSVQWNVAISVANASNVSVVASGLLTASEAAQNYAPKSHSHSASEISELKPVATSGSYNDLSNKPTIPPAIAVDSALSASSQNPVQNKVIKQELDKKGNGDVKILTNVYVSQNTWVSDTTYGDFPYKAVIAVSGITSDWFAEVTFDNDSAISGDYSPVVRTSNGNVTLYSAVRNAITIPSMLFIKQK